LNKNVKCLKIFGERNRDILLKNVMHGNLSTDKPFADKIEIEYRSGGIYEQSFVLDRINYDGCCKIFQHDVLKGLYDVEITHLPNQ
jgi:hypothetical protein